MVRTELSDGLRPPSPAFVIDVPVLDSFVARFQDALAAHWPHSILSYSFKTNSLPWLLTFMRHRGVWAEVVSDTEYELALAMGYAPDRIVYNGPIKSRERLRCSILDGSIVNLDAKREVAWAAELARDHPGLDLAVGLRVNWDLESYCPGESTTGDEGSRFGFNVDNGELDRAISELTDAGVRVAGLHMHRNSKTQSLGVYRAAASVAAKLIRSRRLHLDWIDIGGGFFGSESGRPTFDDYVASIREILEDVVDLEWTRLIVEPGGALIAVPVEFHASVLDVKEVGSRAFVVTNASRTDLDPLFRRTNYEIRFDTENSNLVAEQIISGFTCMEDDRLVRLKGSPKLSIGDRIVFSKVGAYTMSYQSTFIEMFPAVYVRHGETLTQVRRKWGVEDYLHGNRWTMVDDLEPPRGIDVTDAHR